MRIRRFDEELTHHQPSPGKKKVYDADDYYICGNYRQLTRDCTIHYIKTSAIEKLILTAIREVSAYVREDEKEFIRIVRDAASAGQEQTAREQKAAEQKEGITVQAEDGMRAQRTAREEKKESTSAG